MRFPGQVPEGSGAFPMSGQVLPFEQLVFTFGFVLCNVCEIVACDWFFCVV